MFEMRGLGGNDREGGNLGRDNREGREGGKERVRGGLGTEDGIAWWDEREGGRNKMGGLSGRIIEKGKFKWRDDWEGL